MLAWLTFVAAAPAAARSVLGPIVAGRTSTARRQQEDVERHVDFAVNDDPAIRDLGMTHLEYLQRPGRLTAVQKDAVAAAITAAIAKTDSLVQQHPDAAVTEGTGSHLASVNLDGSWDDEVGSDEMRGGRDG